MTSAQTQLPACRREEKKYILHAPPTKSGPSSPRRAFHRKRSEGHKCHELVPRLTRTDMALESALPRARCNESNQWDGRAESTWPGVKENSSPCAE